jgi:twitching motility protein PilT
MNIDDLLRVAVAKGASDLHIKVGAYPMARVSGLLIPVSEEKRLTNDDTLAMGAKMMSPEQRDKFIKSQEVDLAYSVGGLGRFRVNIFQQRGTMGWCSASSRRRF